MLMSWGHHMIWQLTLIDCVLKYMQPKINEVQHICTVIYCQSKVVYSQESRKITRKQNNIDVYWNGYERKRISLIAISVQIEQSLPRDHCLASCVMPTVTLRMNFSIHTPYPSMILFAYSHFAYSRFAYNLSRFAYSHFAYTKNFH